MTWKIRWMIAVILIVIIAVASSYPKTAITSWITKIVYSTQDFALVRQYIYPSDPIPIFVFDDGTKTMKNFKTITASKDGFLLTYKEPISIYASNNGVVIYTAHTASEGKALILAFDNGITAHFEQLTTIHKLPYTAVAAGEQLATVGGGQLYVALFKDGQPMSERDVIRWIHHGG